MGSEVGSRACSSTMSAYVLSSSCSRLATASGCASPCAVIKDIKNSARTVLPRLSYSVNHSSRRIMRRSTFRLSVPLGVPMTMKYGSFGEPAGAARACELSARCCGSSGAAGVASGAAAEDPPAASACTDEATCRLSARTSASVASGACTAPLDE